MCREQVEWARSEKRTFLRQRIEARLANLLLDTKDYAGALALIGKLLSEVGAHSGPGCAQLEHLAATCCTLLYPKYTGFKPKSVLGCDHQCASKVSSRTQYWAWSLLKPLT